MAPSTPPANPQAQAAAAQAQAAAALTDLADVLASYRTCELATVTRAGTPVTWPAVAWFDRAAGRLVLTTTIGAPNKAFNIRRDPRVALLFSDPTGSGRADLPQVLVQGTAECPEEIRTSPLGMEAYWRDLWRHQPSSSRYGATPIDRWLFDFYYMRLVITVTPTAVTTRPPLVGAGPLTASRPARRDKSAWAQTARQLPGYSSAVLATVSGDAPPVLRRIHPSAVLDAESVLLDGADADELSGTGAANLLMHGHDAQLSALRQFGVVGTLAVDEGRALLHPARVLSAPIATTPLALVRTLRRMRRTSQRYLDHRGLERPVIPWQEYRRLSAGLGVV